VREAPNSEDLIVPIRFAASLTKLPVRELAIGTTVAALALSSSLAADDGSRPFPQIPNPKVYVVPMKGQLGTDIAREVYEDIVKDIRKAKPDIVVFHMESSDIDRTAYLNEDDQPREERNAPNPELMRELTLALRVGIQDIPSVMWVEDAIGPASLLALAWPDLYMTSRARFGGMGGLIPNIRKQWDDPDVREKMVAAWAGIFKGLVSQGGYPESLGDAMLYPEALLSVSFEGRKVKFRPDTDGTWVIDSRKDFAANFDSMLAEDVGLSDGTADSLDDLMFLLGYREFQKIDTGEKTYEEYVKAWRKAFEDAWDLFLEANDQSGDARGLGRAKSNYEKIVNIMKRFPAVEQRFRGRGAPGRLELEIQIDQLKEQIRAANQGTRGGGGGGGGRPRGGSAPGGGPGSR
jgi:hypothetical protein